MIYWQSNHEKEYERLNISWGKDGVSTIFYKYLLNERHPPITTGEGLCAKEFTWSSPVLDM